MHAEDIRSACGTSGRCQQLVDQSLPGFADLAFYGTSFKTF